MIINILALVLIYVSYRALLALWRVKFHPLAKFAGPRAAAISNDWQYAVQRRGQSVLEFEKLHQEYGTTALRVGPNELHFTDPALYKTIYSQKGQYIKDPDFYSGFNMHTIFTMSDPQQHKDRRRLLAPFFSKAGIFKAEGMIADKVSRLRKKIELLTESGRNHPINASNAFRCLTIDVITHYAFAESWMMIEKSDDDFHAHVLTAMDIAGAGIWDFIYKPWARIIAAALPRAVLTLFNPDAAKFTTLLDLGRHSYETYKAAPKHAQPVVFDVLGAALRERQVIDEATGMLIAGSDTTAFTLTMAVWYISRDAHLKTTLMKALAEALPDTNKEGAEQPTLLELEAIPYLGACVREALRTANISPGKLPRVVPSYNNNNNNNTNDAEPLIVEGKIVPPGTVVGMSAYTMHTSPEIWGPDARAFKPERWLAAGADAGHLETYLATFSKGLRGCMGRNLAFAELHITLAMLYRHFDVSVDEEASRDFAALDYFAPVIPEPGLVLRVRKLD
ncbi:cytochrome P450 [Xylaria cf. heliscus]|nr:cytochrome P450 [Xylaria cf. heliscus]